MKLDVRHEPESTRFAADIAEGEPCVLEYRKVDDQTLDFRSTLVPPQYRGEGLGHQLVEHGLGWARDHGYRVIPSCPFVERLAEETDAWDDVIIERVGHLPSQGQGKVDPGRGPR